MFDREPSTEAYHHVLNGQQIRALAALCRRLNAVDLEALHYDNRQWKRDAAIAVIDIELERRFFEAMTIN